MMNLNKLTSSRMQSADRIVISAEVMERNIATLEYEDVMQVLRDKHFPFSRCVIEYGDDGSATYFEEISPSEIALIRDTKTNNVVFSSIFNPDNVKLEFGNNTCEVKCPDIRSAAFRGQERVRLTMKQRDEINQTMPVEFLSTLCVFAYINRVCLAEPEIEEKAVKRHTKAKKRNGNPVKYISTKKYILTGHERKSRRKAPKIYTRETWQTRGHWRKYKSGKRVWIKPHGNRRDKDKLTGKRVDPRIYKVGV